MAINWQLAQGPDILGNAMNAFEQGKQMRREEATRSALGSLVTNPGDKTAFNALAQNDPGIAMQFQGQQARTAVQNQEAAQQRMQTTGRLLRAVKQDPSRYSQARAAAIQMGIPPQSIPETYAPEWVDQQVMIADAFEKDGGAQISGMARELQDSGYRLGTPEFAQAMRMAIQGKYATQYTDENGNVRQAQMPALPGMTAPPAPQQMAPQEALTFEMYRGATQTLGPQEAASWLQRNGSPVKVNTPDEARQLPRGTKIILPDNTEGVVP